MTPELQALRDYAPRSFWERSGDIGWSRLVDHLTKLTSSPLTHTHVNQLLHLSHLAGVSYGFFKYYFLAKPDTHPYDHCAAFQLYSLSRRQIFAARIDYQPVKTCSPKYQSMPLVRRETCDVALLRRHDSPIPNLNILHFSRRLG